MSWLNGVIGQGIASNLGACGSQAQQAYGYSQSQAQQQAMAAQQAYGAGMSAGTMNHQSPKWMFNGTFMSFMDFVNSVFPEDTAEKTAFILKHSEQ